MSCSGWRAGMGMAALWLVACEAPQPLSKSLSKPAPVAADKPAPAKPTVVRGEVPVAPFVARQVEGHPGGVLVYVGASWCEPCRHFHEALTRGELDELLPGMQVLEYDLDLHQAELARAGYMSRMIPLFALPNADGTASARVMSGSIKGDRAVPDNLAPRLRSLLSDP